MFVVKDAVDGLPPAIDGLMGRELLFKISIVNDNIKGTKTSYVVEKYSDQVAMIEEFKTGVRSLVRVR